MTTIYLESRRFVGALFGVLAFAACYAAPSAAQQPAPAPICTAVVNSDNYLYLVSQSGDLLASFNEPGPKTSVSLAPDAKKVAYISEDNPTAFSIVDTDGNTLTRHVRPSDTSVFVGVSWDTDHVLKTESHMGQTTNVFDFYRVHGALHHLNHLGGPVRRAVGEVCAAPRDDNAVACIDGTDVRVNHRVVYSENIFSGNSSTVIATLTVPVGVSVSVPGTPAFQVETLSITGGVTLKITLPTGNWKQSRVPSGTFIRVDFDDAVYGFRPTITDAANNIVQVTVVKSGFGASVFDPAIAWRDDAHLAVLERKPEGAQLVMINRYARKSPPISASIDIPEPVTSFRFDTPSLLVFRTIPRFGVAPITVGRPTHKGKATLTVGQITDLPTSIAASLSTGVTTVPVLDWACHFDDQRYDGHHPDDGRRDR